MLYFIRSQELTGAGYSINRRDPIAFKSFKTPPAKEIYYV
jgi:hypothetical protein